MCSLNLLKQIENENGDNNVMPEGSGVQVIPIQWREKISLASTALNDSSSDEEDDRFEDLVLQDLLPEGIPGIRMLVSDVILDGIT
jgi:hypothetical protein